MLAWLFVLGKHPGFAQLMSKEYLPSVKSEFAGTKEIKSLPFFLTLWQLYQELVMRILAPLHIEFAPNTMQYKYVGMVMSHIEEAGQAIVFYTKWKFYQKIVQHNIYHILVCFLVDDLGGWLVWTAISFPPVHHHPFSPPYFTHRNLVNVCFITFWNRQAKKKNIKNPPEDTKNKLWDFLSLNKCFT